MYALLKNKSQVKELIQKCDSLENFVAILNKVEKWNDEQFVTPFERKRITVKAFKYFLYVKKNKYETFEIPKKTGGKRKITKPHNYIKRIQRIINTMLNACYTPMPTATGFIAGKSIVDNAIKHCNKKYVYNIDIENFFPTIKFARIWGLLSKNKFFKIDNEIARIIATICTFDKRLPQGAPTSPYLANVVCIVLDAKFYYLQKEYGFNYTRYADDITISANKNIFTEDFKKEIKHIIEKEGFKLNPTKERLQRNNIKDKEGNWIRERQMVTGLIVNKKPNVTRNYIKNLRATLHNWEKYGYNYASKMHEKYYINEKGFERYNGEIPKIEMVVAGKIEFLGMVRGKEDSVYIDFKNKLNGLVIKEKKADKNYLEKTLYKWIMKDEKAASDYFYNIRHLGNMEWKKNIKKKESYKPKFEPKTEFLKK